MGESVKVEATTITELTPQVIAEAFWKMGDTQQADFFEALAAQVESENIPRLYNFGELQWCYLHSELQKRGGKALQMYLAMSTFAFEFSQDHCGLQQKSIS